MDNKKKYIVFLAMFALIAASLAYAFTVAPPTVQKSESESHEDEQATVLEGVIKQIDQKTAKSVTVEVVEMKNENCANQIANTLMKLGNIGKIRCDIPTKRFQVQYDPKTISESHILNAFTEAQHPGKIIARS